jgi:hypothetical protein
MQRHVGFIIAGGSLLLASAGLAGIALAAYQPHMDGALAALEQAKQEILVADQAHDHGGHAGAATQLIEQAIHEVREGIAFRNSRGP